MLNTIKFSFASLWKLKPVIVLCCLIAVFAQVAWYFLGLHLPRTVIEQITGGAYALDFVVAVGLVVGFYMLATFLKSYTSEIVEQASRVISTFSFMGLQYKKDMEIDFGLLEDPKVIEIKKRAGRAIAGSNQPANRVPLLTVSLIVNIINFLLYGWVIVMVSPVIILLLVVSTGINALFLRAYKRYEEGNRGERASLFDRSGVLRKYLAGQDYAKDTRLFNIKDLLFEKLQITNSEIKKADNEIAGKKMQADIVSVLLAFVRDGASYAVLVYLMIDGRMQFGEFVFIFGAIALFSNWTLGISRDITELVRATSELGDFKGYMNIDSHPEGRASVLQKTHDGEFVLENLSYTYPDADAPTLKNINLTIKPNERIALVGENGCGKTTLVKILCGLYDPTQGTASLNGNRISEYSRESYFKSITAIFQDIHLIAESVLHNVSQAPLSQTDVDRARECLKMAGLWDKIQTLPQKEHTIRTRKKAGDLKGRFCKAKLLSL